MQFNVLFNIDDSFPVEFNIESDINVDFNNVIEKRILPDVYSGETMVDPNFENQILPTNEKYMLSDITVKPIDVFETGNLSGGKTVYIGGIFE